MVKKAVDEKTVDASKGPAEGTAGDKATSSDTPTKRKKTPGAGARPNNIRENVQQVIEVTEQSLDLGRRRHRDGKSSA